VAGNIDFALRGNQAPITVDNFLAYVNAGFYDNRDGKGATIFHRVVSGFVVQGGGYTVTTSGTLPPPKATLYSPIALETKGGSNVQWTAAMARTTDANSATSQFFFNLANNASILDPSSTTAGYAVFADVSSSASVIQAIAAAPCTLVVVNGVPLGDGSCVPIPNVVVTSATQIQ
jgi:peptidyl-prolyl cis-trans isomerase A (cyclophilin A)